MVFEGPGAVLPRTVGAWKVKSSPRYFGPDNLYDLIDGGADVYTRFGMTRMVTADYGDATRPQLTATVEIYDMGGAKNAYGRAARFLSGRTDAAVAGQGLPSGLESRGVFGGADAVFWKSRFLVHLTLLDESPSATPESMSAAGRELLPPFASAIASAIADDPPPPPDLSLFPSADRVARGDAWEPADLLGIPGFGEGFSVSYSKAGKTWIAVSSPSFASESDAQAAQLRVSKGLVKGALRDGRRIALAAAGHRLVGIVDEGEPPLAATRLSSVLAELAKGMGGN
ncbi:MAG: hypothetical protein PHU25_05855 [Deltaproteobacteria bacterium]|nr:hypothetical protein [Deltaproteobacteria bacterium]